MLNILHFKDTIYAEVSEESVKDESYTYSLLVDNKYFAEIDEVIPYLINKFPNKIWVKDNTINICFYSINIDDVTKLSSMSNNIKISSTDLGNDPNILVTITL